MGRFDHAIVYVPGEPDYWIDATAEYSRIESPPLADQGRYALIAAPGITDLIVTPHSKSIDNRTVETREVTLSQLGNSRIVETSEYHGATELSTREGFESYDPELTRESFEDYVGQAYLAGKLDVMEIGASRDFSRPFSIRVEASECGRAVTEQGHAVAAIRVENILHNLPDGLKTVPEDESEPRSHDYVLDMPFVTEWNYRIRPPAGFELRELPASETKEVGPMRFATQFEQQTDGLVVARLTFDTVKRRFTPEEARAIQEGSLEIRESDAIMIWFDQKGEVLLNAGKIRAALDEFRALVKERPDQALPQTRMARAYLAAGLGEIARQTARGAIEKEPESKTAHLTLGWVLEHDLIGRRFQKGFDHSGAVAAYRRAHELAPEDNTVQASLAILLEHNEKGERYRDGARLEEAIDHYTQVLEREVSPTFQNNRMVAMLKAGRYEELRDSFADVQNKTEGMHALELTAIAALEGPEAALRAAQVSLADETQRRQVVASAALTLMQQRLYPQAGRLLAGAAKGAPNAAQLLAQARLFGHMRPWEESDMDPSDPAAVVARFFVAMFGGGAWPDTVFEILSRHSQGQREDQEVLDKLGRAMNVVRRQLSQAGVPFDVVIDLLIAGRESHSEGDDSRGYRVRETYETGQKTFRVNAFVIREEERYVLLDALFDDGVGLADLSKEVLERVEKRDAEGARTILDWAREFIKPAGGDDPLAGPYFPRVWEKGTKAEPDVIRYAAAVLLAPGDFQTDAQRALPILEQGMKKADKRLRPWFRAAAAGAYVKTEQWDKLLPLARDLVKHYPQSSSAFSLYSLALIRLDRFEEAEEAAAKRHARDSDDQAAYTLLVGLAQAQNDGARLRRLVQGRIDRGKASATDMNNYAWSALVDGEVDEKSLEIVEKGVLRSQDAVILHTQSSLYAEVGRLVEAREVLLQSMATEGLEEPDSKAWYVLGRMAEHYGAAEAARSAYEKVEEPKDLHLVEQSVYALAKRRLAELGSNDATDLQ